MYRVLLVILSTCYSANGLIGFDCGGQHLNITTVSLLSVSDCDLKYKVPTSTSVNIQLLQLSEYDHVEVLQCKVEISRHIQHCGMHSHTSAVNQGRMEYIMEVGYTKCLRMFQDGILSIETAGVIGGLKPNSSSAHSIMLAGSVRNDGACKGTQYSDPYGTWDDVIVDAIIRITLQSNYVPVHLNTGTIKLKSGTVCPLSNGFCIDVDNGYTYWKPMPTTSCNFNQYDVLYEGQAVKLTNDPNSSTSTTVYTLTTEDITFALTKTKEQPLCGYTLLRTEHPKLFILETKKDDTFTRRSSVPVNNLDIFTYVNSKFVYVEKHLRHQMTSLYYNVMQQKCELERQVLQNTLSFATLQPDEFAYRLMKGPGYMAVTAGEVVHVIKCIPVDVKIRRSDFCYLELPVTVRNTSLFITPKSHVLTQAGTMRECSREIPITYNIENTWVQLSPEAYVKDTSPQQLTPMTTLSWKYLTPGSLATSGIYSQQDLDKLRDHIMFPAEKAALLNTMARGITGHSIAGNTMTMYNLLDEASLKKIADNTAQRIWSGFIAFGSATAGIFGVLLIIRLIKLTFDVAIHGYALHSAYGCSLYVLGAIWSSLTNLLLYLARGRARTKAEPAAADTTNNETTPMTTSYPGTAPEDPANVTTPTVYTDLHTRLYQVEPIPLTSIGIRS